MADILTVLTTMPPTLHTTHLITTLLLSLTLTHSLTLPQLSPQKLRTITLVTHMLER